MESTTRTSLHPLVATAAISVTLFSAVGIGAVTGLIPASRGTQDGDVPAMVAATKQPASLAPAMPTSTAQPRAQAAKITQPVILASAPILKAEPARKAVEPRAPQQPAVERAALPAYEPIESAHDTQRETIPVAAAESDATPSRPLCQSCGTIEGVREVKQAGDGSGIGAVAGGVAGAVLGRQVGNGRGRTIATVVGAVGGAVAGHQVEKQVRKSVAFEVTVRMDDGSIRSVTENTQPTWRSGDKVRIENGRITSLS